MNISKLISFLFLLIISIHQIELSAQANTNDVTSLTHQLSAEVVDPQKNIIDIGNVLILNPKDSSIHFGDVFYDGSITIETIALEKIILRVTALGYQDYNQIINFDLEGAQVDIGQIVLMPTMLEGVEVIAQKNIIEQKDGTLTVNVANTSLSNAGSALDIIQNAPKVTTNQAGQISVIGKGTAVIYVDGQRIVSNQILSNLSSNQITRLEIIENPSANFGAEGNAVINIITKTKTLSGHKIGLLQEAGAGKHFRSFFQAEGYYKINKLMLQASYGIRPWAWGGRNRQTRSLSVGNAISEVENKFSQQNDRLDHVYSFRTSLDLSPKNKIGFQYSGLFNNEEKLAVSTRTAEIDGLSSFKINSNLSGPATLGSNTLNTYYQSNLDTLGSRFLINLQYSNFNYQRQDFNHQVFSDANNEIDIDRKSNNQNAIQIFTFQTDYNKYLKNGLNFELGLKEAYITNKSSLLFESVESNGSTKPLPGFSNNFQYSENITAGYGLLNWAKKEQRFSVGLRGEWTSVDGQSGSESNSSEGVDQVIKKSYFNIFPSANWTNTFNDKLNMSLSYSYRINRPTFQDLNPYILFVDSLVSLRGNPELVPEYGHSFTGNININQLNINLNYTYTKDKINQVFRSIDPNNKDIIAFVKENLNHTKLFALSLSHPVNYKWYSAYFSVGSFLDDHQIADVNQTLVNQKPGFYVQANQSFRLPGAIKLDTYFKYTTSRVDGVYIDNPISYLNIAVSKKFLNDRLKVVFWANDIFDQFNFTGVSDFNRMHVDYLSDMDFHFFKFSLNWDFGKLGVNNVRERKISRDELNRIGSN